MDRQIKESSPKLKKNERNTTFVYTSDLKKAIEALKKSPVQENEKVSLRVAIKKMHGEIVEMRKKGYEWEFIIDKLKENGIDIKLSTLRTYIYDLNVKTKNG
jgi:hypothetical protein